MKLTHLIMFMLIVLGNRLPEESIEMVQITEKPESCMLLPRVETKLTNCSGDRLWLHIYQTWP